MIGLDTNVLVRYITQDDPAQSGKATRLIENDLTSKEPGFLTLIALIEITWVLESCYDQETSELLDIVHLLLTTKQILVENAEYAYMALKRCRQNIKSDFSDALISVLSEQNGCGITYTFDKKAKLIGMTLL